MNESMSFHPKRRGNKLSCEAVVAIYRDDRTLKEIAASYQVSNVTVHFIKTGKRWSSVTGAPFNNECAGR